MAQALRTDPSNNQANTRSEERFVETWGDVRLLVMDIKDRCFTSHIDKINRLVHHEQIYAFFGMALKGCREINRKTAYIYGFTFGGGNRFTMTPRYASRLHDWPSA
jgi:hypothetical protein